MTPENANTLKIRLLNGPYADQEVILPEGAVVFGNTSDSDFIISDLDETEKETKKEAKEEVKEDAKEDAKEEAEKETKEEVKEDAKEKAEKETKEETGEAKEEVKEKTGKLKFELFVSGGIVTLQTKPEEPLAKILINGEPVEPKNNQLILPEQKVISIGEIDFVLGNENKDLSEIKLQQQIKKKDIRYLINLLKSKNKFILLGVGIIVVTALVLAIMPFFFKSNQVTQPTITNEEKLQNQQKLVATLIAEKNMQEITAEWRGDNTLMLSGYIISQELKNSFLDKLNKIKIVYEDNILDMESIINITKLLLRSKGYKRAEVFPDKRGGFIIIKGKIIGNAHWDAVSKQLLKDVNGLKGWRIISTQTNFSEVLLMLLTERNLSRLLSVVDRDNITFITGQLNKEQADTLNRLVGEVKEKIKSSQSVIFQNIPYSSSLYPEFIPSTSGQFWWRQ